MDKQEILEVFYKMKSSFERTKVNHKCISGFCRWILFSDLEEIEEKLLYQLKKDLLHKPSYDYWYPQFYQCTDKSLSIQPRIDHLNRTITRLENELKTEQNGTIQ